MATVAGVPAALLGTQATCGVLSEGAICSHKDVIGMVPGFATVWSQAIPFTSLSLNFLIGTRGSSWHLLQRPLAFPLNDPDLGITMMGTSHESCDC